jgi:hypothetical protein
MQILVLVLALSVQEEWKVECSTTVSRTEEGWTFRVTGKTDFPDGTVLRGRVDALYEADDLEKGGKKIEQEPFYFGRPAWQRGVVKGGAFSLDVYSFVRRPYSLPYRLRVQYNPEFQDDETREAVGGKGIDRFFDFREGDEEELAEELNGAADLLHDEFLQVRKLFDELKKTFARFRKEKTPDRKAWTAWLDPWMDRVDVLKVANGDRFDLWILWIERQGKFRIEGFCSRLPDLASDCSDILFGQDEVFARMQYKMRSFLDYYEEAIEVVGLNMPLDVLTIGPALAIFEAQVKRLDRFDPATWKGERAEFRRIASQALMDVAGSFGNRKRGYYRANRIIAAFRDLLEKADGAKNASGLQAARKALAKEVAAFKKYAGIR